ncbi:MAG: HAD family hydrolase [Candidatus Brocadiae bacterium]|nr:HAD family hydrolase [Candidatus Brocadiia bacterium]
MTLPHVDTVLFDMDGTLSSSERLALDAAVEGLGRFYAGIGEPAEIPDRGVIRGMIGLPSATYFARLVPERLRFRWEEVRRHVLELEIRFLAEGRGGTFEGTAGTLRALRRGGKRLGLVTNAGRGYFRATMDALGLDGHFGIALCIDDAPGGTKADLVRLAAAALGTRRGAIVGDKSYDVEAGRACGFATVGCTWGYGSAEELRGADVLVHDIREIPALFGVEP